MNLNLGTIQTRMGDLDVTDPLCAKSISLQSLLLCWALTIALIYLLNQR